MPAYGARNVVRRVSEADVCGRVVAGAQAQRVPLWSAFERENRAAASEFV